MDFNKARVFANNLDDITINQFKECVELPFVTDAALMPDAHLGYVAPIGSVIVTRRVIVPSWVGYDIGCGVTAIKLIGKTLLPKVKNYSNEIFDKVRQNLPMGLGKLSAENKISKESKEKFKLLLSKLEKKKIDPEIFKFIKRKGLSNLGSLGHGNHFVEIDYHKDEVWIVVHTGSRNIGHKIATYYMKKAMEEKQGFQSVKTGEFEKTYELKTNSKIGKEYLAVLDFLLEFALLNRIEIASKVINEIELTLNQKIKYKLWTNKNHNHAVKFSRNLWIHRKGATPSKKGERGVIPANMRDGSFLIIGKGSKKFIESSSHGAGRSKSKKSAKETINLEEFKQSMKGIIAIVGKETIDESPNAYKEINEVLKNQKESIKIVKHLKPIINFKGY